MNIPSDLKYTKEHEWVRVEGDVATIGITDYAQGELGDIVFVELPDIGAEVKQLGRFGTIEAVKAVSDLFSPVSGKVVDINKGLDDDPMVINRDPYGGGWIIKVKVTSSGELAQLLGADGYKKIVTA
ncbi:MAG: glycine cleavage system protein GcvH [candidate division Zixibacteria bacterium]|nr:glycine cleavage system protein GcvH [candidate division Zixibacteria bacterium]